MKKGLYDQVIDSEFYLSLLKEENASITNIESSEDLDNACRYMFEKKLLNLSSEDKKSLLNEELKLNDVQKLVAIPSEEYDIKYPETGFNDVALFTGSLNEPTLMNEFQIELLTTDTFKMLVSFIKTSGITPILDDLKHFTDRGGKLEIITTTYTKASDFDAICKLAKLRNTTIKISYDNNRTRLHAKSYLFIRNTNLNSAYVGSSNFSHPAMNRGLEWNVKLTTKNNARALFQFQEKYDQFYNDSEFEIFYINDKNSVEKLQNHLDKNTEQIKIIGGEVKPYFYQEHLLKQIEAQRNLGIYRNLLVAATGTGKTIIAAFDFKKYKSKNPSANILFIAHRVDILKQSLEKFRIILNDFNFGNLYTSSATKDLFITIQSINKLTPEQFSNFDYIVVDEVHHGASSSYNTIFKLNPKILLGLTATPYRTDGQEIVKFFGNRISAELNLIDALNNKMLCPFNYFGVTDSVDLSQVSILRGDYQVSELEKLLLKDERINLIVKSIKKYTILDEVKGIGFCTSIVHANYMAEKFNNLGITSVAIHSKSESNVDKAKSEMEDGTLKFIFAVDIFNEGIDIPCVNTLLLLRPTKSSVIYLQQLGRGLRLSEGKEVLTVLDFIGNHNDNFKFSNIYKKILIDQNIKKQTENNKFLAPLGCEFKIEEKAREYIMNNISKYSAGNTYYRNLYNENPNITFEQFILDNDIILEEFYSKTSFTTVKGIEKKQNFFNHIIQCGDVDILLCLKNIVENNNFDMESVKDRMALRLVFISASVILQKIENLSRIEPYFDEIVQLIDFLVIHKQFEGGNYIYSDVPLKLNSKYNDLQINEAFGRKNVRAGEGVSPIPSKELHLLWVTINKHNNEVEKGFGYEDEILNKNLMRWATNGKRSVEDNIISLKYKNIMLVRESKTNEYGMANIYEVTGEATFINEVKQQSTTRIFEFKIDGLLPLYNQI